MSTDVLLYLAAFAGGFLGATFGALIAFVFTGLVLLIGIAVLIGTGDPTFIGSIAFGPFFGPHISFAGGVAAAAFAAKKGWLENGADIGTPLVKLAKPAVLLMGGAFGLLGVIVQQLVALVPWFGANTDSVAMTVVISAIIARFAFGKSGLIGPHSEGLTGAAKFRPTDKHVWIPYQSSWMMSATLGVVLGALAAWAGLTLLAAYPDAGNVVLLGFGLSAFSLLFLALGQPFPVTHHMTIIAAIAAANFLPITGSPVAAVIIGAVFGGIAACVGEGFSRLWTNRGDTFIDPPASTIWPMTTVVLVCAAIFGG